jgi:UPF0271 protein
MAARKVYVLDTTAILATQLEPGKAELATVQEVVDEVVYGGLAPERLSMALSRKVLKLRKPSKQSVEEVSLKARERGELGRLSKTDILLLAAAVEEKKEGCDVVVVSDDYSVQNMALYLGLQVLGVARQPIKEVREYVFRCSVCGKTHTRPAARCPDCGGELERVRAGDRR